MPKVEPYQIRFTAISAATEQAFLEHKIANDGWVVDERHQMEYSSGLAIDDDGSYTLIFDCGIMTTLDAGYFGLWFDPVF